VRTVIVDNGSPNTVVTKLNEYASYYQNVTVLPLDENTGFARGNNAGIRLLREEGYEFICCSNNDIIFEADGVLETLKNELKDTKAAIAGPRIITSKGEDQNPNRIERPNQVQAEKIYNKYYSFSGRIKHSIPKNIRLPISHVKRKILSLLSNKTIVNNNYRSNLQAERCYVYSLHGAFIMFGPVFFKHYCGFDENTFLYWEEDILGEMLLSVDCRCLYVPYLSVLHKEDKTSDYIWNKRANKMKKKYIKHSIGYWYNKYYKANNSRS